MNRNFWGESDEEPLPEWMDPKTYHQPKILQRKRQTLEEAAAAALEKPPVPILLKDPTKND